MTPSNYTSGHLPTALKTTCLPRNSSLTVVGLQRVLAALGPADPPSSHSPMKPLSCPQTQMPSRLPGLRHAVPVADPASFLLGKVTPQGAAFPILWYQRLPWEHSRNSASFVVYSACTVIFLKTELVVKMSVVGTSLRTQDHTGPLHKDQRIWPPRLLSCVATIGGSLGPGPLLRGARALICRLAHTVHLVPSHPPGRAPGSCRGNS